MPGTGQHDALDECQGFYLPQVVLSQALGDAVAVSLCMRPGTQVRLGDPLGLQAKVLES